MNGKPYTISSDTELPEAFMIYFGKYNISAGIFLPINVNAMPAMYLCFLSLKKNRKWSVEDLRFTNDVKSILHTILVKKITKNSLASSYSALDSILQNAGYGVAVSDMEKNSLLYTNETFEKMFSLDVDRMAIEEILFDKKYLLNELNGYFANGSQKWYDINFSNIKWVDGREVKLTTFYDITDLRSYQKRIEKQACEDLLTGLLNRQTYERDVNSEYHFYQKTGSEFAVLMIDLDDFANINEGSGSKVGDELLKFISSSINEISQIKGKVYRVGGDEFAVLVDHEIYKDLDLIVKRIRNLFDNPWVVDGVGYYCSMSMGGVKSSNVSDSVNILTRLSIALHDAKKNGKNQFMLYDENADVLAAKRLKIEQAMRRAVEEGCEEFEVYYQPIMEMVDGVTVCCGAEALCRWNSKEMGFVMPDEFIAIAEQLGLISEIGEKVLFAAAKRCKHWNDFGHPEFKVNINLSVIQLTRTDIVDTIRDAINFTGINPRNLTFEVTESLAINDMERMIAVLEQIRSLGCRVALDDFGTGYSSLSYIKNLPIDTIKIDKSFINDVTSDGFAEAFVKTVAELADSLDIDVCVEGVEHDNQLQMIDRFSVNLAQGFFFDRPITGEEFEDKYI
ncbi:MAG: bifunctional diguanylate cyclase/phosphodiesterase [Pseudobutyrivibrio sp.]|nr:bifunctional diguanylate cyclase/phosphodiesterase [Pseudobutyrivibrio sp.]